MAALGIWLWSNPGAFGDSKPCTLEATTVVLGHSIPLGSRRLRVWSMTIYSLFLVPGVNLILPMALFLSLFLGYQAWHLRRAETPPSTKSNVIENGPDISPPSVTPRPDTRPSIVPTVIGMGFLITINLIFLIDIEVTLQRNRSRQTPGESAWTFGQILALLLLVLPLRDLVETISERRETKRKSELAHRDKKHLAELIEALRISIRTEGTSDAILDLVQKGADVNTVVEGTNK